MKKCSRCKKDLDVSLFNKNKRYNDIIRLNHYSNLQPLWAKDNYSKGSSYIT